MKIQQNACFRAPQLWTGLPFLLACALISASQKTIASTLREDGARTNNTSSRISDTSGLPAARRYEFNSLSAADSGDQLTRPISTSSEPIVILYPDIGEPYRSIFAKIIEGIEQQLKTPIHSYAIVNNQSPGDLPAQLKRNGTKVVIALGRQGLKVASAMENDFAVVAGGVLSIPESEASNLTGISLTPDPALLFLRLKNLIPTVKRIIVIYNPQNNDWLLKLAHDAAKTQGLEIVAYEARDLAASARLYETAFSGSDSRRDAVWLPQDATTVDEATILPLVLKESWNRGIPIFSSSSLHVKRGALFSLSLNPIELGRSLAGVAQTALSGDAHKHGMRPLREVYSAINVRTASHIGLNIDYQKQRSFDFVYPEP